MQVLLAPEQFPATYTRLILDPAVADDTTAVLPLYYILTAVAALCLSLT